MPEPWAPSAVQQRILDTLKDAKKPLKAAQIAQRTGDPQTQVKAVLEFLAGKGFVTSHSSSRRLWWKLSAT